MDIIFTNTFGIGELFPPEPASKNIPLWYKNLDSYMSGEKKPDGNGNTTATIKKCMPVFDAINAGYIIKTPVDVYVSQKEANYLNKDHFNKTGEEIYLTKEEIEEKGLAKKIPYYEWPNFGIIEFHPIEQAPTHPNRNGHQKSYPKWINPWSIKTPLGYSVMFVQPFHRDSLFTIFPGIVDTDKYTPPVNFPFVLNDINWEGMISAGTPIAQVIPFKRENWQMKVGGKENLVEQDKISNILKTRFFDSYKSQFRSSKEYK